MFGLSTLATQIIIAGLIAASSFGGGIVLERHIRNGDDAVAQVARDTANKTETDRQVGIAFNEFAIGQQAVKKIDAALLAKKAKERQTTETLISKVPKYVPDTPNNSVNVGFVRLYDAAIVRASDPSSLPIAPGQPDGAASDVALPEVATVSVANAGICREYADRASAAQQYAETVEAWYKEVAGKLGLKHSP